MGVRYAICRRVFASLKTESVVVFACLEIIIYEQVGAGGGGNGKLVATVVLWIVGVTFYPHELYVV